MTTVLFYLLDIGQSLVEGRLEIKLWGVDSDGNSILFRDRTFAPWFCLVFRKASDAQDALDFIQSSKTEFPKILSTSVAPRKFFGEKVTALKVTCPDQESATTYRDSLRKLPGVVDHVEDDLRPREQYLLEKGLAPCGWIEAEVERDSEKLASVRESYFLKGRIRCTGERGRPRLKVMSFATLSLEEKGSPKPDNSPLILVSAQTSEGRRVQFEAEKDEAEILLAFAKFIREADPDVIVGYQANSVDWLFLIGRAKALGSKLNVDRMGGEPHPSVHGHISIAGRANLDLFEIVQDQNEPKVKTLQNVAEYLGIVKSAMRVEDTEVVEYWKNPEKKAKLREYLSQNVELVLRLSEAFIDYATQLSNLTGLPLDQVAAASMGFKVDSYLLREAYRLGELIPRRAERQYRPYRGGLVLAPKPGLHEDIAVLDFTSMYPNLMLLYNVSPDTLIRTGKVEGEAFRVPELEYAFRKAPQGMYAVALENLLASRNKIKNEMNLVRPGSVEFRALEAREKAVKTIANAMYGYAGWIGARWYVKEVAESTAALGRRAIEMALDVAKKLRLELIYGDTDSIFVKNDAEKVAKLRATVTEMLKMEIRVDKVYKRVLFTEAKKRYAGLREDGAIEMTGLEAVRGDWSEIAKNVQEMVVGMILRGERAEKAAKYVKTVIDSIRGRKVAYSDLVIWKTLTKPLEEYEVRAPHVEAARQLMDAGWRLTLGDRIGYVITSSPGKLYQKAKPYVKATINDVDVEYYVTSQVVPAALRILQMFGIGEDELVGHVAQRQDRLVSEFLA